MAEENKLVLEVDVQSTQNLDHVESSMKSLRQEVKEYRNQLTNLTRGTAEYNAIALKMGQTQQRLDDIMDDSRANARDFGENLGVVVGFAANLTTTVASLGTAFTALGADVEDVNKIMVKVQAMIALVQGVKGLTGLYATIQTTVIPAVRSMWTVMAANPLGAVATAVGLLVAGLSVLVLSTKSNTEELEKFNNQIKITNDQFDQLEAQISNNSKIMAAEGATTVEILKAEQQSYRDLHQVRINDSNARVEEIKQMDTSNKEKKRLLEENRETTTTELRRLEGIIREYNSDIVVEERIATIEIEKENRKKAENRQKMLDDFASQQANFQIQMQEQKQIDIDYNPFEIDDTAIQEWTDNANAITSLEEQFRLNRLEGKERELEENRIWFEEQKALYDSTGADITNLLEEQREREHSINAKYNAQEARDKEALEQTKLRIASSALNSLASILGEQTEAGKIAATAAAIIDTYAAANAAYKSMAGIPIVGPALGAAAAGAAILAGIANVKKIMSTDPNNPNTSTTATPQVNYADTVDITHYRDLTASSEVQSLETQAAFSRDQRVYVVESDITDTQNRVRVAESEAIR